MNCYILAGGESRRMGRAKTELFLDRVVAAARPVFEDIVAVQRHGGPALAIRTIFEEDHEGAAPLFGVERALRDARDEAFILAIDYPLITPDVLRYLLFRFEAQRAIALVPVWDGLPQPLCAAYDVSLLPLIEQRLSAGLYDMIGLVREVDAQLVDEFELRSRFAGESLMNVNTPEELERAEVLYGR